MASASRKLVLLLYCLTGAWIHPARLSAQVSEWLTTPDRRNLLALQPERLRFHTSHAHSGVSNVPEIVVDDRQPMQSIAGFGLALTGGSAQLLMRMHAQSRHALLEELFAVGPPSTGVAAGAGLSHLRVSIGSSDMNEHVFTYDEMPPGETDPELKYFSLGEDLKDVVPVLEEILKIDPTIEILATPWSAPSWMKTNGKWKGGSLRPAYYDVYAHYLANYVQQMAKLGIPIAAMTPQNEPLNPDNTPSMLMTAGEEDAFLKQSLGPVFRRSNLNTRIILYDHNCDRPDYPLTILADKDAAQYTDGTGFHLYGGAVAAMTEVHDAYPNRNIYFTEQMVVDDAHYGPQLGVARPVKEIVIGATRNWSRNVLLWNLAADPHFGPHTDDGGCPVCEGAITLDGDTITRNLGYYTIAQVAKFVRPGAVRIASTAGDNVPANVAFKNKDGRMVLLVANAADKPADFNIRCRGKVVEASLEAGAVATYIW
jgi:glucosylceramidase